MLAACVPTGATSTGTPDSASKYDRSTWGNWATVSGKCDTRETVLKTQGQNVVVDANCKATSGTWTSPYDSIVITQERLLDIDHIVPLKEAWLSGAGGWNAKQRNTFYNDLDNLVAVSQNSNRSKGDSDPAVWIPSNKAYVCTYISKYVAIKTKYHLSEDNKEQLRIQDLQRNC